MRIGFDAKRAFLNNTGLGNYSRDSIRLLSKFYSQNNYFLYTTENKHTPRLSFLQERDNLFICEPKSILNRILKAFWRSKRIVQDLLNDKITIYHGLTNELPLGIEKTNIKTIVTIHDLIFIRYPKLFKRIDREIYLEKFKSASIRADKIIAVSKQTKKDIIDFFSIPEEKIEVVYQGCNLLFQKEIKAKKRDAVITKYNLPKRYLLYVGTIEERKNLLTILEALNELPEQKLVVIGNGKSYKTKCLKYASKHNLSNRVLFMTNIKIEELAAIYQTAEMLIYPSIFEGFGIPILEALFSKTPVITSKGSCFSEAGGKNSIYINPLSKDEIKDAVLKIQSSPELKVKMKEEGFKYAQKFTDVKIAKQLMQVYEGIMH